MIPFTVRYYPDEASIHGDTWNDMVIDAESEEDAEEYFLSLKIPYTYKVIYGPILV